jgi:arabinogalactan endo-1,4-beta-galactosidase
MVLAVAACSSTGSPKTQGTGGDRQTTASAPGGSSSAGGGIGAGGTPGSGGTTTSGGISGNGGSGGGTTATGGTSSGTGGSPATGGKTIASGGASSTGGVSALGGTLGTGGSADAGPGSGGRSSTGAVTAPDGAAGTGGRPATGGSPASGGVTGAGGGSASGGARTGGTTGAGGTTANGGTTGTFPASYLIGADISFTESVPSAAQDDLLSQLQAHGFNAIRLRTFVDPKAADGYDKANGNCDIAHTVTFGKKVKDRAMFLLVDFHYSDNWADPGKQCVPVAWQGYTTIADLATAVHDYTKDSISKLIGGGARPDMVQIGNETTPGMLIHVCDSGGQPTGNNQITGSTSNWTNLGTLFKAGVQGVRDVDTGILTALHIDRGGDKATDSPGAALNTSKTYINNAIKQGVTFDVFGESCYQQYQGDPNNPTTTKTGWTNTLGGLASAFPNLKIMAAEYGPMQREINDVVFGIANRQGIGTFNWEPEQSGDWNTGHLLFTRSGNTYTAQPDLALYDQMKVDYASRL